MFDVEAAFQIDYTIFRPAGHATFGSLLTVVVRFLIVVAGILSLIFVIIGGIKLVTSGGDPKNLESARSTITYAIIGVVVALLSFMLVSLVQRFVGSNIQLF